MDLLFVLIAVCPAVILANYDLKGPGFTWKALYLHLPDGSMALRL